MLEERKFPVSELYAVASSRSRGKAVSFKGRTIHCQDLESFDFSKVDEVIAAANNTRYGLAAYVFTNDLSMAWKMAEGLEAGIIGVNDPVPATPQCPFGGMKESGLGRELAHEGLDAYLETKYVSIKLRD